MIDWDLEDVKKFRASKKKEDIDLKNMLSVGRYKRSHKIFIKND